MRRFIKKITACTAALLLFLTAVLMPDAADRSAPANTLQAHAAADIFGIDVSKYQETIDWQAVAQSGVKFAIIRCCKVIRAYDDWEMDSRFEENYAGAKAAGIAVGCYMYTDAATQTEFEEDVDFMMSALEGKSFEFPVFVDLESASRQEHLSPKVFMPALLAGLERIEDSGHTAGVYSSSAFYSECIDRNQLREEGYAVWVANYFNTVNGLPSPAGYDLSNEATIWQYSGCGRTNGISTTVDCNICYTYQYFTHNAVITNSMLPTGTLREGSSFTVGGTVSSDAVIRSITGAIYAADGSGEPLQSVKVHPHAREYKLTGFFTKKLVFSDLPSGEYLLRITATDSSNTEIVVTESPFSITPDGNPLPTETEQTETEPQGTDLGSETENESNLSAELTQNTELTETSQSTAATSTTVKYKPHKGKPGLRFVRWLYDHWLGRSLFAKLAVLTVKLSLERTPFHRIVTRISRIVELNYMLLNLRIYTET